MSFDLSPFLKEASISEPKRFIEKCELFYELLIETNRTTNLTRITDINEYRIKHILDSLMIAKYFPRLRKDNLQIADIGCGAGFPSVPLALAFPNLNITAIDSIGKKTNFIELAASQLKIENLTTMNGRARELNRQDDWIKRFDIITARAVSEAKNIHRETKNMLKDNGSFIFYKTPEQAEKELPDIIKTTEKSGFSWDRSEIFELPKNSGKRLFLYSERN
jgi:16S rRNA (guanine527-N7)-methyltransferase